MSGVSVVVPVHNGELWLRDAIAAILAQSVRCPCEVLLVDDHSTDRSSSILDEFAKHPSIRIVSAPGRGAAAAINAGVRAANHGLIAQVDQDVVLQPGWIERLLVAFDDPMVGAAQGYYLSAPGAGLFARVMNLDLEQRYARIDNDTDHVCTGNSIYRAEALHRVGLFDETLGYGYDNDVSYRLREAGYRLRIDPAARAVHRWREGFVEYLTQQYGFGYGRIDLVAKHPHRAAGDAVSPGMMMMHPVALFAALAWSAVAIVAALLGRSPRLWWTLAGGITLGLTLERLYAGVAAARRFRQATALAFPFVHLIRDLAWVGAIVVWTWRRLARRPLRPSHSMTPRRDGLSRTAHYRAPDDERARRESDNRGASAPAPKRPRA